MSNNISSQYDFFKNVNLDANGNLGVVIISGGTGGGSSSAQPFKFTAENFTELGSVTGMTEGDLAYVYYDEGTKWLPGSLGGTYYPSGVYIYERSEWISNRDGISYQFYLDDARLDALEAEKADLSGATFTGGVITPSLSASTITGTTFYGDGSNLTGISGSGSLQDAYDASTSPEIVTDGTNLAVTLQDGTNNPSNNILEVKDFAGNNKFFVSTNNFDVDGLLSNQSFTSAGNGINITIDPGQHNVEMNQVGITNESTVTASSILHQVDNGTLVSRFRLTNASGADILASEGANSHTLAVSPTNISVTSTNGTGIQYNSDYSGTFVNRSLVDKEYVDTAVSSSSDTNLFEFVANSTFIGNTIAEPYFGEFASIFGHMMPISGTVEEVSFILGNSSAAASESFTVGIRKVSVGSGTTGLGTQVTVGSGTEIATCSLASGGALGNAFYRNAVNSGLSATFAAGDLLIATLPNVAFWTAEDIIIKIKVRN